MRTALDVHRALLARGVAHEIVRLRSRIASADDLPEALGLDGGCVAVRLYCLTRRRGAGSAAWVAVLVPAGAVPDPSALLSALDGEAVRPATAAEVNTVTGYPVGLVSPVALPDDVVVLADAAIGAVEVVYAPAGEGGVALGVRTGDLLVAIGARVATLTPAPLPPPGSRYADIIDLDDVLDDRLPDQAGPAYPPTWPHRDGVPERRQPA